MKPENKSLMFLYLYLIVMLILGILIGWCSNELYKGYSNHRILNGLYLSSSSNWTSAMNTAKSLDKYGSFICVNVRGMSYGDAIETINHEVIHHVFSEMLAQDCEKNTTRCQILLDK